MAPKPMPGQLNADALKAITERAWTQSAEESPAVEDDLQSALSTITHGNSLPTLMACHVLLAAKAADARIDAAAIQKSAGASFDFRSYTKRVHVPKVRSWADDRGARLNIGKDPFVSHQFRSARLDRAWAAQRRGGTWANALVTVLETIESRPEQAYPALVCALSQLRDLLDEQSVQFNVPARLDLACVCLLIEKFVSDEASGDRLERVGSALFTFVGQETGQWDQVDTHNSTDPSPWDNRCWRRGSLISLVQFKHLVPSLEDLRDLAACMTQYGCARGYLVTSEHFVEGANEPADEFLQRRHVLGQRIDILTIERLVYNWLALIDSSDDVLPRFLMKVGDELREWSGPGTQRAWSQRLSEL
jgi:hypothetical protein